METPVGGRRFNRYYRSIGLGLRMLLLGARMQTASAWSGLSPDQLAGHRERWMPELGEGPRGSCPTSFQPFFRSADKTGEAALFVSLFRMVGLHSTTPSLEGGEALCDAYEIFKAWEPQTDMEFDYGVLLAMGSVTGEAIALESCAGCDCALLIDRVGRRRTHCGWCRKLTIVGRRRRPRKKPLPC